MLNADGHERNCALLAGASRAEKAVSHLRTRLDDRIHHPVRFSLMAALAKAEELEFRFLGDTLGVSDSVLSREALTLEEAGYVTIRGARVEDGR